MIVALTCPGCAAPAQHLDGALIAVCEFCGAVVAGHKDAIGGAFDVVSLMLRAPVAPTLRDARWLELDLERDEARRTGDRARWRQASLELALLGAAEAGPDVARWARVRIATDELLAFERDAPVHAQLPREALVAAPAVTAAAHLAELRRRASAVVDHPAYPVEARGTYAAETLARDALRAALVGITPFVPRDVVRAAFCAAFASPADGSLVCHTCGGPLDPVAPRCPWCLRAVEHDVDDLWDATQRAHAALATAVADAPLSAEPPATVALAAGDPWVRAQRALWRRYGLGAHAQAAWSAVHVLRTPWVADRPIAVTQALAFLRSLDLPMSDLREPLTILLHAAGSEVEAAFLREVARGLEEPVS